MKFLIDECLPRRLCTLIAQKGHEALWVRASPLVGSPDAVILDHAKQHGFLLITRDLEFGNLREYPPESHRGIIVLRLPSERTARQIASCVERFFDEVDLNALPDALTILEEDRYRIRRLK